MQIVRALNKLENEKKRIPYISSYLRRCFLPCSLFAEVVQTSSASKCTWTVDLVPVGKKAWARITPFPSKGKLSP